MKNIKLYNIILPIWFLLFFPLTWFVVLPANFIIDFTVVALSMKYLKIDNIKKRTRLVIVRVWILGFIADFIGGICMFILLALEFDNKTAFSRWWYDNISSAIGFNPLDNIYSIILTAICVFIASIFIYLFNSKFTLNKLDISIENKKKIALYLAIFTAPVLFFLPTSWFY